MAISRQHGKDSSFPEAMWQTLIGQIDPGKKGEKNESMREREVSRFFGPDLEINKLFCSLSL